MWFMFFFMQKTAYERRISDWSSDVCASDPRRYDKAIDTSQIHTELSARLREELDYAREARHMALYRRMLADEKRVFVPEVVPALSTDRLLTMTWQIARASRRGRGCQAV